MPPPPLDVEPLSLRRRNRRSGLSDQREESVEASEPLFARRHVRADVVERAAGIDETVEERAHRLVGSEILVALEVRAQQHARLEIDVAVAGYEPVAVVKRFGKRLRHCARDGVLDHPPAERCYLELDQLRQQRLICGDDAATYRLGGEAPNRTARPASSACRSTAHWQSRGRTADLPGSPVDTKVVKMFGR